VSERSDLIGEGCGPDETGHASVDLEMRVPTSVILEGLLHDAPKDHVTLNWIIDHLGARSFGIIMLIIALVGLVPGASPFIGILLAVPAIQMMMARPAPVLPRIIAGRKISTPRFVRLLHRVIPILKRMERVVRPRWRTPFEATKRVLGIVILLLGATLLAPIPFSHIIPAVVVMLLAFAFLEEDGVLLSVALAAAVISLSITIAAVWGTIEASLLL
jgi:hypothetical protein